MYLIVIAWIYVVLMMSVAEASNSNATLMGAMFTFVIYGVGPVTLVVYLMGAPARSKAIKKRHAEELAQQNRVNLAPSSASDQNAKAAGAAQVEEPGAASLAPDAGGHAPGGSEPVARPAHAAPSVAPVRKEP